MCQAGTTKALHKPSFPWGLLQVPVTHSHANLSNTCMGQSLPLAQLHIQGNQSSGAKTLPLRPSSPRAEQEFQAKQPGSWCYLYI